MKIQFVLPALEEAKSPFWRPIKYSLFPPLGLATLAAFCSPDDEVQLLDEHVEPMHFDETLDLVCLQTYITNAYRAYEIADTYRSMGVHVAIGGLHATSLPEEALQHADTLLLGLGEGAFPEFLQDFRKGNAKRVYEAQPVACESFRSPRRNLIKRENYLVPNSLVFSRGCPNRCSFCYVSSFYKEGKSFYTYKLDAILKEIESLKGRHLYFLDDNLFADKTLCKDLFTQMKGMGKLFQGAVTVRDALDEQLLELAYEAGLRSAFIGFETLDSGNLASVNKDTNRLAHYEKVISAFDRLGIMINGSFIFGLQNDTQNVFHDTAAWAVESGITTATFHILTPYPGTQVFAAMHEQNKITSTDWREYDTRHLVFSHDKMSKEQMEAGYRSAYTEFYRWRNILAASQQHERLGMQCKHFMYSGAWKKFEGVWNFIIKNNLLRESRKILEATLK